MAVRRKPQNVEQFIEQGGGVPRDSDSREDKEQDFRNVRLRIPLDILEDIDTAIARRRSGISRHTWIMEAILAKLAGDSS